MSGVVTFNSLNEMLFGIKLPKICRIYNHTFILLVIQNDDDDNVNKNNNFNTLKTISSGKLK